VTELQSGALPEKKSSFGCLKILIIAAAFVAVILLIFGIMVWGAISWVKNAAEAKAVVYAPLNLSPGEKEDVARVVSEVYAATNTGADIDESITPQVFNCVIEKMIEDDRKTNKSSDPPSYVRAALTNNGFQFKASVPMKDPDNSGSIQKSPDGQIMYVNAETEFRLEIESSVVTQVEIQSLKLHDQPAPFLIRLIFYRNFTDSLKKGQQPNPGNPNQPDLQIFKTLKVEGQRVHFVLDGKKIKEQEERKKAAQNSKAPAPKSSEPRSSEPESADKKE